jgi:hypothetical protein
MSRALVEDQLSIDAAGIPHLNEESAFGATIRWGSGHSMDLKFDPIHEQLMLRWRSEGTSCQQTIYLTTTGPNFGGKRRWFVCDQSGDRVRKLYWCPVQGRVGGGWYGRRAIGLTYHSQRLSDSDRPMLRAQRIRRKLGSDDGTDDPEKPNGMHWTTYNRLLDEADELDEVGWMSALGGLLSRVS